MEPNKSRKSPAIPDRARPIADPLDALIDAVFAEEIGEWPAYPELQRVVRYHRPRRPVARHERFGWELDTTRLVIDAVGPHRLRAAA